MAGVKFHAVYRVTSVDPPELVRFIKSHYPDVKIEIPHDSSGKPISMWTLIPKKLIPPTRMVRYCCERLKETNGKGEITVTGVRWAESARRRKMHDVVDVHTKSKKLAEMVADIDGAKVKENGSIILNDDNDDARRFVEQCYRTRKTLVNPIVDWTDEDVWGFLNDVVKVEHCELYDRGYKRIGCIGCPLSYNKEKELAEYPKYRDNYLRAFAKMLTEREARGIKSENWKTPQDVMDWWISDK